MPPNESTPAPRTTLFHAWHVAHGARMVDFAGYDMPVQYAGGIIREHLATRRAAGLFDVSHMGRFRVAGPRAETFLAHVLTSNVRALEPGEAQYAFIANEAGGAVDDAYLYRLAADDFLLVVNASNRAKDWQWLEGDLPPAGVRMVDDTEAWAMVSLQGPRATDVLARVIPERSLPEAKRNRLSHAPYAGTQLIVARTGYTGEAVCYELFCPAAQALGLWEQLAAEGATACGLGARDSLRLEAGLPLYGHELGTDADGREIPIFANDLARFAVRAGETGTFVGRTALDAQREEAIAIRRGTLARPVAERLLARLVRPIAAFGNRKPLRAGYRVLHDGRPVGVLTSGTSVPYSGFTGSGLTAEPNEEQALRPIGLALIDSDLSFRTDRPVRLTIDDGRDGIEAELVERHLLPAAPFARAAGAFVPAPALERLGLDDLAGRARALAEASARNTHWRRHECINLIPSEQSTSAFVDSLCIADPAGRYNEHNPIPVLGPHAPDVRYYEGTAFIMAREEELKAALRTFFDCTRVEARVISGQMANDTVYDALKQYRNRHRPGIEPRGLGPVLVHDLNKGGHLSAQVLGALRNYVRFDPRTGRPDVLHFPFEPTNPYRIDVQATCALIAERRPELIVFGRSVIIEREPVRAIADFVHAHFGRDHPDRPVILYDGAHVLGLIGPHYQSPLDEGADLITGSTHKTFFGPQRGVILSRIAHGSPLEELWAQVEKRAFPGHVSNHHLGTLLGLLGATLEMLAWRDQYPARVIANARAFAAALAAEGLAVEGDASAGHTATHQVVVRTGRSQGQRIADLLEANGIITNPQALWDDPSFTAASGIRMGTQEMTRHGMGPEDFRQVAALIARIVRDGARMPAGHWAGEVRALRSGFVTMQYVLP